jgi:plasmid stabilization system protein ParE
LKHSGYRVYPAARRDLEVHSDRIVLARNPEAALEFIESARRIFVSIGENPGLGSPIATRNVRLTGLRKRNVPGFESYLVFYTTDRGTASILRVMHRRQDWWGLLDVN